MHTRLSIVLQHKGTQVHSISPTATVLEAVRVMNTAKIGALLVMELGEVVGIFTERDVLGRIVDQGRDPATTKVVDVMTAQLITVRPETTVEEAMAVVTAHRCRHLPVMDGASLIGLVSSGDLMRWVTHRQAWHIEDLVNYITGKYPA